MKTVVEILCLLLAALVMQQAAACGCSKPKTMADLRYPSLVFRGQVESITKPTAQEWVVTFKVLEQYQGPAMQRVEMQVHHGGTSCDLEPLAFEVGDVYLMSSVLGGAWASGPNGKRNPIFYNNYCSLRELVARARQ